MKKTSYSCRWNPDTPLCKKEITGHLVHVLKKSKLELYEQKGSLVLYVIPTWREGKVQAILQVYYVSIMYHFSLPEKSISWSTL